MITSTFDTIYEATRNISVLIASVGRFNPLHKGHEKLVKDFLGVKIGQNNVSETKKVFFVTDTHNNTTDPLVYDDKVKYLSVAFPEVSKLITKSSGQVFKSVGDVCDEFATAHPKDDLYLLLFYGQNVSQEQDLSNFKHPKFKVQKIEVPRTESDESSTQMREFAKEGKEEAFLVNLPEKLATNAEIAKECYNKVREGLGINKPTEEIKESTIPSWFKMLKEEVSNAPMLKKFYSRRSGIPHIEDLVCSGMSSDMITLLKRVLNGSDVQIKYDGLPSIFFGKHPATGQFFVATKSIMNVVPKVFYSESDIMNHYGQDADQQFIQKMVYALRYLHPLVEDGIWCGDYLWCKNISGSLVGGESNQFIFQPNLVKYTVMPNTEAWKALQICDFGIAIHSMYTGDVLESIVRSEPDFKKLNFENSKVWSPNTIIDTKLAVLNDVGVLISELEKYIKKNSKYIDLFNEIGDPESVKRFIMAGPSVIDIQEFEKYAGYDVPVEELEVYRPIFAIISDVIKIKSHLITALNRYHTTIVPSIGDTSTGEGYILKLSNGDLVKLVDKEVFTKQNKEQF